MRSVPALVVLPLFFAALSGVLSRPPSAEQPTTTTTSVVPVKRWNGLYSVDSNGGALDFVGLNDRKDRTTPPRTQAIGGNKRSKSTTPFPQTTDSSSENSVKGDALTTWSIAWYLVLLAGFVVFFFLIGLMEVCCRRRGRLPYCCGSERTNRGSRVAPGLGSGAVARDPVGGPPPPYELFKPPSYSTLFPQDSAVLPEKKPEAVVTAAPPADHLVYVINVHSVRGVS